MKKQRIKITFLLPNMIVINKGILIQGNFINYKIEKIKICGAFAKYVSHQQGNFDLRQFDLL